MGTGGSPLNRAIFGSRTGSTAEGCDRMIRYQPLAPTMSSVPSGENPRNCARPIEGDADEFTLGCDAPEVDQARSVRSNPMPTTEPVSGPSLPNRGLICSGSARPVDHSLQPSWHRKPPNGFQRLEKCQPPGEFRAKVRTRLNHPGGPAHRTFAVGSGALVHRAVRGRFRFHTFGEPR